MRITAVHMLVALLVVPAFALLAVWRFEWEE